MGLHMNGPHAKTIESVWFWQKRAYIELLLPQQLSFARVTLPLTDIRGVLSQVSFILFDKCTLCSESYGAAP